LADSPRLLYWCHERVFLSFLTLLIVSIALPRVGEPEHE